MTRPIYEIAQDIRTDWSRIGKGVNYAAEPYLDALQSLSSVSDNYGLDSGREIVLYFLSNAATYRGDTARILKGELKKHLGR